LVSIEIHIYWGGGAPGDYIVLSSWPRGQFSAGTDLDIRQIRRCEPAVMIGFKFVLKLISLILKNSPRDHKRKILKIMKPKYRRDNYYIWALAIFVFVNRKYGKINTDMSN